MTHPTTARFLVPLLLGVFAIGCASSGESRGSSSRVLTQEEMLEAPASDLYEVVDRLRPRWLQARAVMGLSGPPQILVFLNRTFLGGPEELRQFEAIHIHQLRYLDGPQAAATLSGYDSSIHVGGAIVIDTSARDRDQ
jgi:hypothetical protein